LIESWKNYPAERTEWTFEQARSKIESYKTLYQGITLDDGLTLGRVGSGIFGTGKWDFLVKKHIPGDLFGKRVLDIGCNAGIYCIECCRRRASEVVGIEIHPEHFDQALFVKSYLEWKEKKKYPIKYMFGDAWKILKTNIGKFDIVIIGNLVYYMKEQQSEFMKLTQPIADKIIITGNKGVEYGKPDILKTAMRAAGFQIQVVDDGNYYSPLLIGTPVRDFEFEIIKIRLDDLDFGNKIMADFPQVSFLKKYMLEGDELDIKNTHLFEERILSHVKSCYFNNRLNETVGHSAQVAMRYCGDLIEKFKSIKEVGYLGGEHSYNYIPVVKKKNRFRIVEGYHRISILFVLGYEEIEVCKLSDEERNIWLSKTNGKNFAGEIERMMKVRGTK